MKLNQKYNILDSLEKIAEFDSFLLDTSGKTKHKYIAVDTETNGLRHWKDVVIGVSFSVDSKSGFYLPFLSWKDDSLECFWTNKKYSENVSREEYVFPEWATQFLKRWLLDSEIDIVMHNAVFDCLMIESSFGLDVSSKVFCDTMLLKHVLDENTKCGLKETAIRWKAHLDFPIDEVINQEQIELGQSVEKNKGTYNKSTKQIWRADLDILGKYAIADTFLTYGLFEVGLEKFFSQYEEKHWNWFFIEEVMPLCKEVVIPMAKFGTRIDVKHFEKLKEQTVDKLNKLEDEILKELEINGLLDGFSGGKTIENVVSNKKLIEKIIAKEGLEYPTLKGKASLSKKSVEAAYNTNPHWVWSYILGDCDIKYSKDALNKLKNEIYQETTGKRYAFNINSDKQLRWLFCRKLRHDEKTLPQTDAGTSENPVASMKAEVLETFFLGKYPFVKPLLLYKKLQKLLSTYILPALNLNDDGLLYMSWLQHGTVSGRFACAGGYNLQTLPKVEEIDRCEKCESKNLDIHKTIELLADIKCKDCGYERYDILCSSAIKQGFIAPEGVKIVNTDFSSLEPRCFSFCSGDDKLKEVYRSGLDLYSKVYCDMEDKAGKYSANPKAENYLKKIQPEKRNEIKPTCFVKGTKVPTTKGLKSIQDIVVGDYVITKLGAYQVTAIMNRTVSETLKIYTNRQVLHTTKDHKIWDFAIGDWKEAQFFNVGDVFDVVTPQWTGEYQKLPIFSNASFKNGAFKALSYIHFNEDWAWILGAFLGDGVGCYTRRKAHSKRGFNSTLLSIYIGICGLDVDSVVFEFRERLKNYGYVLGFQKEVAKSGGNFSTFTCHDFELGKIFQSTFKAIKEIDSLNGGKNLRVQDFVFNSPQSVRLAFLAGLLDTDGYLKKAKAKKRADIAICSRSIEFASDIGLLLASLNVSYSINLQYNKTYQRDYYTIQIHKTGVAQLKKLGLDTYLICERKKAAVSESSSTHPTTHKCLKAGYIKKIEKCSGVEVFDITVDKVHEFIANNVRVHNCLGIPYGARAPQVANLMNYRKTTTINGEAVQILDVNKGQEFRDKYLKTYEKLHDYMILQEAKANALGFVETLVGRRRHFEFTKVVFELLNKSNIHYEEFLDAKTQQLKTMSYKGALNKDNLTKLSNKLGFSLYDVKKKQYRDWAFIRTMYKNEINNAKNFPIQGLAAHITNRAMLEMTREFKKQNIDAHICMQVHDEITVYCKETQIDECCKIVQKAMELNIYTKLLDVPMEAEPIVCDNLKDSK